jgi:hypothetical protein
VRFLVLRVAGAKQSGADRDGYVCENGQGVTCASWYEHIRASNWLNVADEVGVQLSTEYREQQLCAFV